MRFFPLMIAGLVTATTPALGQTAPVQRFVVAIALSRDDQVVEAPSLTIPLDSSASMEVSGRYRIETALRPAGDGHVTLEATIFRPDADRWLVVARPEMTLAIGELTSVNLTDAGWESVDLSVHRETDVASHPGT